MKKVLIGIVPGLVIGFVVAWLVLHHRAEPAKAEAAAAPAPAEKPKENPLQLNAAKREKTGVTLAKPSSATLAPEVAAFGRVLDPVPLIALAAEVETARAALDASQKEVEREQKLFAAGVNASAQTVETATAAVARDRATLASARARLIASVGHPLADTANLAQMVAGLEQGRALARLDVLAGDTVAADAKVARVSLAGSSDAFDATVLGAAPTSDPQVSGQGFLVLLKDHPLPAGAALRGTLPAPGETEKALVLPRSAVVYHQGSAWIYVLGEEDTFERKLVTLGRTVGDGVVIASGAEPDEQVAITGAGQLLSAELQAGGAPEEP
jgi:hypothetical protein